MADYSVAWNMMLSSQVKSARMIWVFLHLANFLRYLLIFWELCKKLFFWGGGGGGGVIMYNCHMNFLVLQNNKNKHHQQCIPSSFWSVA